MEAVSRRGTTPIPHELTTTSFELPGCTVVHNLGLVRGVIVRSRSIFGMIGAKIETIFGGNISLYTAMCEKARENAFDVMIAQAQTVGANAVIGIRYDAAEVMSGVTEVLCYGTAVIVEESQA